MNTDRSAYEHSDVPTGGPLWFSFGLILVVVGAGFIVWELQSYFARQWGDAQESAYLSTQAGRQAPGLVSEPPLQGTPDYGSFGPSEVAALRASEERLLTTYGWHDRDHDLVHIPIRRAMKLLVERGLKSQEGTP